MEMMEEVGEQMKQLHDQVGVVDHRGFLLPHVFVFDVFQVDSISAHVGVCVCACG